MACKTRAQELHPHALRIPGRAVPNCRRVCGPDRRLVLPLRKRALLRLAEPEVVSDGRRNPAPGVGAKQRNILRSAFERELADADHRLAVQGLACLRVEDKPELLVSQR